MRVSVRRQGGGYWTGSGFDGFSEYYMDATLLSPGATTTSWGLPLPLPQDGAYTVHVQARDVVGNDSAPAATSSTTFAIDTAGPTTSLATDPASPNGANGWFRRPFVDFTLTATDPAPGSGVAGTSYRIDGGAWQSYGGAPVSIATQGDHLVTFGSVDNAGNPGPTGTARIAIDNVSPATAVALSPVSPNGSNGWRRTPTSFTLSATDATSGVASTSYRIDGGPVALATGGAVAIPEGQHTLTYWSEDVAGNPEPPVVTPTIKVDTLAPSTTIATTPASPDGDNGWFRQSSVSFTLNGTDATSGIASRHYTIDGGTTQAYTGPVTIATPGAHVVTYWSVDVAGNVEVAGTTNVKIDAVAPTTVITSVPAGPDGSNGWFKRSSVTFTLAATDATSGVASTVYTVDGGAPHDVRRRGHARHPGRPHDHVPIDGHCGQRRVDEVGPHQARRRRAFHLARNDAFEPQRVERLVHLDGLLHADRHRRDLGRRHPVLPARRDRRAGLHRCRRRGSRRPHRRVLVGRQRRQRGRAHDDEHQAGHHPARDDAGDDPRQPRTARTAGSSGPASASR